MESLSPRSQTWSWLLHKITAQFKIFSWTGTLFTTTHSKVDLLTPATISCTNRHLRSWVLLPNLCKMPKSCKFFSLDTQAWTIKTLSKSATYWKLSLELFKTKIWKFWTLVTTTSPARQWPVKSRPFLKPIALWSTSVWQKIILKPRMSARYSKVLAVSLSLQIKLRPTSKR